MSIYIYEAYDKNNEIIRGEYETSSREEVVEYLTRRFLTPISVESTDKTKDKNDILSVQLFKTVSPIDILFFVRDLAVTTKAGLSVVESFDILMGDTKNKFFKKILQEAQATIKNGQPISTAFEAHREFFPPIFFGMLKAGEASGQLDKKLEELAMYLSKENTLKNKVKSALTYPIILLVAAALVIVLMLIFVLPRLAHSFVASNVPLPWVTKFFLFISRVLTWSFAADAAFVGVMMWFFFYFRTTKTGKNLFSFIISHTPVANELVKKISLVRFTRTLGSLIDSGLHVTESLVISGESINEKRYTYAIEEMVKDISNGISISNALKRHPDLFPNLLVSLVVVGERTGSLQEILTTFAVFYDEEVDNQLKQLISFLEPMLLLFVGLVIGAIAISIIIPIYQLVGHFV